MGNDRKLKINKNNDDKLNSSGIQVDEYYLVGMKTLLDDMSVKSSNNDIVKEFINEQNCKVLNSTPEESNTLLFKGQNIKYVKYNIDKEETLIEYIDDSENRDEYNKAYLSLHSSSIAIIENDDKITFYKAYDSEFSSIEYLIDIRNLPVMSEVTKIELISNMIVNQLYLDCEIEEEDWLKIVDNYK